ncbi:MAG: hypothetical protein HY712_03600 [candidate division NC10 bacterium]|nr:hypothetical protein [candidate division NC10 bacterium]
MADGWRVGPLAGLALIVWLAVAPAAAPAEPAAPLAEASATPLNLWPIYDRREDPIDQAQTEGALGPLLFSSAARDGGWREGGFRPFFTWREEKALERSEWQVLYPLIQYTKTEQDWEFQFLLVDVRSEGSIPAEREERADFFPFYLSGRRETGQTYRWLFPFGGTVYDRLGRDEIEIVLFPFYLRSVRSGGERRWFPWPFVSTLRGEDQSGIFFWPLYGQEERKGKYERRYLLWPLFLYERAGLDSDNPEESLAILPFYFSQRSPERDLTVVLWPFFSYQHDRKRQFEQWEFPWPLFAIARGEGRQMTRFLPLFTVERRVLREEFLLKQLVSSTTAVLFPLYVRTVDETASSRTERVRLLWWLYSDIRETGSDGERRRIDSWPLFRYARDREGRVSFQALALLEAFLPGNELIERNYSPLWSLYTYRRNVAGDQVHSFLWNLVRHETTATGLRLEVLGPLLAYDEQGDSSRFSFLGGLFSLGKEDGVREARFFGLRVHWAEPPPIQAAMDRGGDQ